MPIRTRADLRCDGGGVLEERDDLRAPLPLGVFQRRVAILPTGKRGEGRRWRGDCGEANVHAYIYVFIAYVD